MATRDCRMRHVSREPGTLLRGPFSSRSRTSPSLAPWKDGARWAPTMLSWRRTRRYYTHPQSLARVAVLSDATDFVVPYLNRALGARPELRRHLQLPDSPGRPTEELQGDCSPQYQPTQRGVVRGAQPMGPGRRRHVDIGSRCVLILPRACLGRSRFQPGGALGFL